MSWVDDEKWDSERGGSLVGLLVQQYRSPAQIEAVLQRAGVDLGLLEVDGPLSVRWLQTARRVTARRQLGRVVDVLRADNPALTSQLEQLSAGPVAAEMEGAKDDSQEIDEVRTILREVVDEWRAQLTHRAGAAIIDYSAYIADKTHGFTGRQFVFDAIDRFISGPQSGYLLIRGDPGVGKTSIIAELVRRRAYPHHFNISAEGVMRPGQFFGNACAQLIACYELEDSRLPVEAELNADILRQTLEQAAGQAESGCIVLLVDALDEATAPLGNPGQNPLLLPYSLPDRCRIIATTRRTAQELEIQAQTVAPLELIANSEENLLDVRTHLETFVKRPRVKKLLDSVGWTDQGFVSTLEEKSEGNFMYLRYVLPNLEALEPGGHIRLDISDLPQGLRGYYEQHWIRMRGEDIDVFVRVHQRIIAVLATAREPVSASLIAKAAGIDIGEVAWTIEHWQQFLHVVSSEDGLRYRIYHASYRDFLERKSLT